MSTIAPSPTIMGFRALEATEDDLPRIAEILTPAYQAFPAVAVQDGPLTPENYSRITECMRRVMKTDPTWHFIKCVTTDPSTGQETIVGCGEWIIPFPARSQDGISSLPMRIETAHIRPKEDEVRVRRWWEGIMGDWRRYMGGKPHGGLMYMAVDPAYRRRGAGSACVRWGMERCQKLDMPASLFATEQGQPMYAGLGWEVVGDIATDFDGTTDTFPCMVWPASKEQDA